MEKVTVRISKASKHSSDAHLYSRTISDDIQFLMDAFEISHHRAQRLNSTLEGGTDNSMVTYNTEVDLSYRQLARYTAKRQVEGLNKYWKYPHVLEHIEHEEPEQVRQPIELRPTIRTIP